MPYLAGIGYVAGSLAGDTSLGLDSAVDIIKGSLQNQISSSTRQTIQVEISKLLYTVL